MNEANIDEWKAIFTKYNIPYTIEEGCNENEVCLETDNGVGYIGFCFCVFFTKNDGMFLRYGVYE